MRYRNIFKGLARWLWVGIFGLISNLYAEGEGGSVERTLLTSHQRLFSIYRDQIFFTASAQFPNAYGQGGAFPIDSTQTNALYDSVSIGVSIPMGRRLSFVTDLQCLRVSIAARRDFVIPVGFRLKF